MLLRAGFGDADLPAYASLEVAEPDGHTIWSYPDDMIAAFVAGVVTAIDADRLWIRDDDLHDLLVDNGASLRVGSHIYAAHPLTTAPPAGTRQLPCGPGTLVIVPVSAAQADHALDAMAQLDAALPC